LSEFELEYIAINTPFYKAAVTIREKLFFKDMTNSLDLINDEFETTAKHVVCLNGNEVIGTGRLHTEGKKNIISQMAVKAVYQKKGVGSKILNELIGYSRKNGISNIALSARATAIHFYKQHDFIAFGAEYPSQKTGIMHQQMVLMPK